MIQNGKQGDRVQMADHRQHKLGKTKDEFWPALDDLVGAIRLQ
jgi:hypothetical protein